MRGKSAAPRRLFHCPIGNSRFAGVSLFGSACISILEGSRLVRHLEDEFAAGHDVGVADLPVGDRLAVERHRLHVLVLAGEIAGNNTKLPFPIPRLDFSNKRITTL